MTSIGKRSGKSFDAVILDLTIRGGMGGAETIKNLLGLDPDVRAIASSGYSNDGIISSHEEQGFKAFLQKPYNIESLREVLHNVLNS